MEDALSLQHALKLQVKLVTMSSEPVVLSKDKGNVIMQQTASAVG